MSKNLDVLVEELLDKRIEDLSFTCYFCRKTFNKVVPLTVNKDLTKTIFDEGELVSMCPECRRRYNK